VTKNHFVRTLELGELIALRRKIVLHAQCTSLTFIKVKNVALWPGACYAQNCLKRCQEEGGILWVYIFPHKTIVFNYVLFNETLFFSRIFRNT